MVTLEALPVTANGKLDRHKLQQLPWEAEASAEGMAPRNQVERQIAASFAEALGLSRVNIDDDFFDLGGHSLLAVTVMRDIESRLGLTLPPGALFEQTTVRALAEHVASSFASVPKPLLLAGNPEKPAIFMLVGVHLYRELARRLQHRYSVYGVYAGRELVVFEKTGQAVPVAELAREYIEIIRRQQPTGPYRLVGMSMGGIVAYEVAQQLRAAGE
jgi:acyl carrier protein